MKKFFLLLLILLTGLGSPAHAGAHDRFERISPEQAGYSREKLDNLYEIFSKHDKYRVFFARFLPGARSLISLPAGSADMDAKMFF